MNVPQLKLDPQHAIYISLLEHRQVFNAQIGYAAGNCPDRQTAISKNDFESFVHRERTRAKLRLFFAIPRFYGAKLVEANISRPST